MKVAARCLQAAQQCAVVDKALSDDMNNFALALHDAVNAHQARTQQLAVLSVDEVAPYDDIHAAGFIFECYEHHTGSSAGALTTGDDAGGARKPSVRKSAQLCRGRKPHAFQTAAQQRQRMTAEREPGARIIGHEIFTFGRRA